MVKRDSSEEQMSKVALNILSTIIAAGIIANIACLWRMSERLTRIEYQLGIPHTTAQTR